MESTHSSSTSSVSSRTSKSSSSHSIVGPLLEARKLTQVVGPAPPTNVFKYRERLDLQGAERGLISIFISV